MDKISFKEKVAKISIEEAKKYKNVFVDHEYLICSDAFLKNDFYIISAKEDNYKHLIGVNTSISANDFFHKCMDGTLSENDFDFSKIGRSEKEIKGSVRRKIKALPSLNSMFDGELFAQEDFLKNGISCSFATSDSFATIGFVDNGKARPKSLMKGNTLNINASKEVDLILQRNVGDNLFDTIIHGDAKSILKYKDKIENIVSPELFNEDGM